MGPLRGVLWEVSVFDGQDNLVLGSLGILGELSSHHWLCYPGGIPDCCANREPGWPQD